MGVRYLKQRLSGTEVLSYTVVVWLAEPFTPIETFGQTSGSYRTVSPTTPPVPQRPCAFSFGSYLPGPSAKCSRSIERASGEALTKDAITRIEVRVFFADSRQLHGTTGF